MKTARLYTQPDIKLDEVLTSHQTRYYKVVQSNALTQLDTFNMKICSFIVSLMFNLPKQVSVEIN